MAADLGGTAAGAVAASGGGIDLQRNPKCAGAPRRRVRAASRASAQRTRCRFDGGLQETLRLRGGPHAFACCLGWARWLCVVRAPFSQPDSQRLACFFSCARLWQLVMPCSPTKPTATRCASLDLLPEDMLRSIGVHLLGAAPCCRSPFFAHASRADLVSACATCTTLRAVLATLDSHLQPGAAHHRRQWLEMRHEACRDICARSPRRLMQHLRNLWFVEGTSTDDARALLRQWGTEWLPPISLGALAAEYEYCEVILEAVLRPIDLAGMPIDGALRALVAALQLPGEAGRIDGIFESFAQRYHAANPGAFSSADVPYILFFSTLMLNIDQHNPAVHPKNRMTEAMFLAANRGVGGGFGDPPDEVLLRLHRAVRRFPLSVQRRREVRPMWEGPLTLVPRWWSGWSALPAAVRELVTLSRAAPDTAAGAVRWRFWGVLGARQLYLYAASTDDEPAATVSLDGGLRVTARSPRQFVLEPAACRCEASRSDRRLGRPRRCTCVQAVTYYAAREAPSSPPPKARPFDLTRWWLEADSTRACSDWMGAVRERLFETPQ